MTPILIFGSSGFLGQHLFSTLAAAPDFEPIVVDRNLWDITDRASLVRALRDKPAQVVMNMTAISSTKATSEDVYRINAKGQLNMLEALVETGFAGRHIFFSSSNVYGAADASPLHEDTRPRPVNHYSCAKLLAEHYCEMFRPEVQTTIVRPFSVIGAGQKPYFLLPKLAHHFANALPEIELGNLDVSKDFVDARDLASMILHVLRVQDPFDIMNLCNGEAVSIGEILDMFRKISGHNPKIVMNPDLMRAKDILLQIGDPARIKSLGYKRRWAMEETVRWLYKIAKKGN